MKALIISILIALSLPEISPGGIRQGPVDPTLEPVLSSRWICYIKEGDLYMASTGGAPMRIRDGKKAGASIMSPDLKVVGDYIFVAWIERGSGGNRLMFVRSIDKGKTLERPLELISEAKVIRAGIIVDGKKRLYLLEEHSEGQGGFINISTDQGQTFKRLHLEMGDVEYPYHLSPVVAGDTLYIFFSGLRGEKEYVGVTAYEAPSMRPSVSAVLMQTGRVSFLESFVVRERPVVVFKTMRGDRFALEGVVKEEGGWESFSIGGAEGLDVARMDYHVWDDGRILIVFSGEERGRFKQRIYAAISNDGKNWDVLRLDSKQFDNTRSWLPRIAADGDKIAVVWEDSRDIRSGIRMRLSPDRGETWIGGDIPVSAPKHYAFRPRISLAEGVFYVAWHQFRDDERRIADIVMEGLNWDKALKMASKRERGISIKKKEAMLRERVNAYWKGMMRKDLKTTYMIHDPFYRARVPFDYYASRRGPMVYHSYSIEGVRIEGNEAYVKLRVRYGVPRMVILGKDTSIPVKEVVAEDIYLFIDGTWYRKFVDVMSGGSAIDY